MKKNDLVYGHIFGNNGKTLRVVKDREGNRVCYHACGLISPGSVQPFNEDNQKAAIERFKAMQSESETTQVVAA